MTPTEAVRLTGYIQAHFPHQPINEYTPDALHELLAAYPAQDCRTAVLTLSQRTSERTNWCAPSDVAAEVKRIRSKRIAEAPHPIPPPDLTEAEERAWIGAARKRIADGEAIGDEGRELVEVNVPGLRELIARPTRTPAPEPLLTPADATRHPETQDEQDESTDERTKA